MTTQPTPTGRSGVTAPRGFLAAGVTAGLKASGRPDLALVVNAGPRSTAAGLFTGNRIKAAPVLWSARVLADGQLRAVVLNSGGANACTGPPGFADTHATAEAVAEALGVGAIDVAVCSTGLIGVRLDTARITAAVPDAVRRLDADGGGEAAGAILTTDTVAKQTSVAGAGWTVGGMAKGAAMLAPGLATMLVVLTTDAQVEADLLRASLAEACRTTFDRLDTDGCMSTNDSVVAMASGASGVSPREPELTAALTAACRDLAAQMVADAEGAAHEIAVTVSGAATEADAVEVARSIARSALLKCAVFGGDPNWGRVLAALGTTAAAFEPDGVDVSFNGVQVCRGGAIGDDRDLVDLSGRAVAIDVDLHAGDATATVWTTDLTYDYVRENAEYAT